MDNDAVAVGHSPREDSSAALFIGQDTPQPIVEGEPATPRPQFSPGTAYTTVPRYSPPAMVGFFEEPSVVLATRVLNASDNPSPPPSPADGPSLALRATNNPGKPSNDQEVTIPFVDIGHPVPDQSLLSLSTREGSQTRQLVGITLGPWRESIIPPTSELLTCANPQPIAHHDPNLGSLPARDCFTTTQPPHLSLTRDAGVSVVAPFHITQEMPSSPRDSVTSSGQLLLLSLSNHNQPAVTQHTSPELTATPLRRSSRRSHNVSLASVALVAQESPSASVPTPQGTIALPRTDGSPPTPSQLGPMPEAIPSTYAKPKLPLFSATDPDPGARRTPTVPCGSPPRRPGSTGDRDVPRTPARRIPISQALKEGTFSSSCPAVAFPSSHKFDVTALSAAPPTLPVFKPVSLGDPTRSPAKRIPIFMPQPSLKVSATIPERSQSEEPRGITAPKKPRSASVEVAMPAQQDKSLVRFTSRGANARVNPTYPIVPVPRSTTSILEVDEPEPYTSPEIISERKPPDVKVLRQTSKPFSRIPQIGGKLPVGSKDFTDNPGPRQPSTETGPPSSSSRQISRRTTSSVQEVRIIRRATGKQSTRPNNLASTSEPAERIHAPISIPTLLLKRKRDEDFVHREPQNAIRARRDDRGIPTADPPKLTPDYYGQEVNRKAHPATPTVSPMENITAGGVSNTRGSPPDCPKPAGSSPLMHLPPQTVLGSATPNLGVEQQQSDSAPLTPPHPTPSLEWQGETSPPPNPSPLKSSLHTPQKGVRRTTRKRQPTVQTIAGTSRRRQTPPYSDALAGMSSLALKSVTASNTLRNQQHVVELHTQVVRMDTKRPDSPTTKVRTALEQQKEERQRRAERRAQQVESVKGDSVGRGSGLEQRAGATGDQDDTHSLTGHRRGPGEDEAYETPPKPDRPYKRGKFQEEWSIEKRVRWDRGLSTTVYLDEMPIDRTFPTRDDVTDRKGCLSMAAKAIRLDTMGNALNAATPLLDLVHENIVVKKFVYLDDPNPDIPQGPVTRSTRSRGGKAKS